MVLVIGLAIAGATILLALVIHLQRISLRNQPGVGNRLLRYFVSMHNCFVEKNPVFHYKTHDGRPDLLAKMPVKIERPEGYGSTKKITVTAETVWEQGEPAIGDLFVKIRPIAKKLSDGLFAPSEKTNGIVVHFRCSDVPFNRHPSYEMPMYRFYRKYIDQFRKSRNFSNEILLITNDSHKKDPSTAKSIGHYQESLLKFLRETYRDMAVAIRRDGTEESDFRSMQQSRFLIAQASSFAFCAALGGNQETAVVMMPRHMKNQPPPLPAHIVYAESDGLDHAFVADYNDCDQVVLMLRL